MDEEPVVKVTLADIYAVVVKAERDLQTLTNKVEGIVSQAGDHETRLRVLESSYVSKKSAFTTVSVLALIVSIGSALFALGNQLWSK